MFSTCKDGAHACSKKPSTQYRQTSKTYQITTRRCFASRFAVSFAQSIETRCYIENEDVVGEAPTGDSPIPSDWSTGLLSTKLWLILAVWRYKYIIRWKYILWILWMIYGIHSINVMIVTPIPCCGASHFNILIFPLLTLNAKVVPLHKKDDKMKLDNYRPISLLSSISKVFEKVVFNQLTEYFKLNNLLFEGQYGFRDKHSTELATVELMDRVITALEEKRLPISIFMDLSKAFDTLDHKILLSKLQYYGVTGTALNWFNNYLSNRSQYVEINCISSDVKNIDTGVPQGSILGPLLFLIYMNDIPKVSKIFKFILYADDTTLFSTIEFSVPIERSNVNQMLNYELSLVCEWLNVNKLSLNINKTKFMVFHPYQKEVLHLTPCLKIADTVIENVNEFNFLGVHLDSHMTWKSHTDKLALKLSKYTGILNKLKHYLPSYILRTLYFTLIHSHLNYAILTWGYKCNRLNK